MTWYSPQQIAFTWEYAGGSRSHVVMAVAVALAESGGNTTAESPSSDYGLWQINSIHFGDGIIGWGNWDNAVTNAREAIRLSGNGSNWAAWCTMWADPAANCGHGFISYPQMGSAVSRTLPEAEQALGNWVGPPKGYFPITTQQQLQQAWTDWLSVHTNWGNWRWRTIEAVYRYAQDQMRW